MTMAKTDKTGSARKLTSLLHGWRQRWHML
jgi:hypothetical protein